MSQEIEHTRGLVVIDRPVANRGPGISGASRDATQSGHSTAVLGKKTNRRNPTARFARLRPLPSSYLLAAALAAATGTVTAAKKLPRISVKTKKTKQNKTKAPNQVHSSPTNE